MFGPWNDGLGQGALAAAQARAMADHAARDDGIIRDLLSRWVSGVEPAVARDYDGAILGLCDAAAAIGAKPWLLTPR